MLDAAHKTEKQRPAPQSRPVTPPARAAGDNLSFQLFTQTPAALQGQEREADMAASAVVGQPPDGAGGTDSGGSPTSSAGTQTAPPVNSATTTPFGVIVEDGLPLGDGQIHRSQFLETISAAIERAADEELVTVGRTARDCPYIVHWLRFYRQQSPAHIEHTIQLYARPERTNLEGLREAVLRRVREATHAWVRSSGRVLETPPGVEPLGSDDRVTSNGNGEAAAGESETATVQRLAASGNGEAAGSAARSGSIAAIRAQLAAGRPFDGGVRHRMERGFGRSFADVRLHTDQSAAQLTAAYSARAFTLGSDVAFGAGQYRPGTLSGDLMIAHELAHVIQQRGGQPTPAAEPPAFGESSLEADADSSAVRAVVPPSLLASRRVGEYASTHPSLRRVLESGAAITPARSTGLRLQRCGGELVLSGGQTLLATAPTTTDETFAPGRTPGVQPVSRLLAGDVHELTFDGDGDQIPELGASLRPLSSWPSGAARQVRVDITMLSTSEVRSATYDLPDTPGGSGPLFVTFGEPTDGRRPSRISLVSPGDTQNLLFYPPQRTPQDVTYRAELSSQPFPGNNPPTISQSQTFTFPVGTEQLREVFHADAPVVIGRIHAVDITVGAYRDRFRLTFNKPDPNQSAVIFGISVLSEGAPVAGQRANLTVQGPLNVRVLQSDAVRLALDLNGDGQADLELFDRLSGPSESDNASPLRYRAHNILAVGSGLPAGTTFDYPVRDGLIVAGSTSPRPEDRAAASNAQAVTGLAQQQSLGVPELTRPEDRGTIVGEMDSIDAMLNQARARALESNLISRGLFDAWDAVAQDFILLESQIAAAGSPVQSDIQNRAATHAQAFYDAFATAAVSADTHGGGKGGYHHRNPFTGMDINAQQSPLNPGQILAGHIRAGRWREAVAGFRLLVHGLDRWIAEKSRERFGAPDPDRPETSRANEILYLTHLRQGLASLSSRNPVRVAAVFHPREPYLSSGRVTEVPLSLYYVQEGGTWYLYDYSNPREPWHTSGRALTTPAEASPPHEAFLQLNEGDHFPVGTVHYQLRGGIGGEVTTTGPGAWRQWLTYIGLGAAAIGLGLVTFGTGTVAVIGTYALAASALAGGTMAAIDLYERWEHGTLTAGTFLLDMAQIVASLSGIGALGAGRILSVARVAAAESAPLTGARWAMLAGWAQRSVIPLAATNVAADTVTLAVMLGTGAQQYDAIDNAPGTPESRRRAKMMLLAQLAVTGGLTALSLRGNVAEITRGRSIEIVNVGGEPVVVPVGQSAAGTQVTRTRPTGNADDAAFQAAERQHLENVRGQIEGEGGRALADVEGLALSNQVGRPDAALVGDAAGNLTRGGQPAGTLQELVERVARANNASRAHGVTTEYVLDVRPGTTPGTTEVRVVGRARQATAGAVGPSTGRLYVDVPARAQRESAQLQRLLAADQALPAGDPLKGSRVEITPDGMIGINRQLDVHPNSLAQVSDADLPGLLRATRELEMRGDLARIDPANRRLLQGFTASGSYRLRFGFSRQAARSWLEGVLRGLGLDINTVEVNGRRLFANMSASDLDRLYEAIPAGVIRAAPRLQQRAASYAISRNPDSVRAFVEHYEFFVADFKRTARVQIERYNTLVAQADAAWQRANSGRPPNSAQQNRIRQDVKDSLGIPRSRSAEDFYYEQLETGMADPADVNRPSAAAQQEVFGRYEQMRTQLAGRVGIRDIPGGLSNDDAIRAIRNLPEVTFSTESAAVYHARKHFTDLPEGVRQRATNEVTAYLDTAAETVRSTASNVTVRVSQDGTARSFHFTRVIEGKTMRAIVIVTNEGRVMLATFQ